MSIDDVGWAVCLFKSEGICDIITHYELMSELIDAPDEWIHKAGYQLDGDGSRIKYEHELKGIYALT